MSDADHTGPEVERSHRGTSDGEMALERARRAAAEAVRAASAWCEGLDEGTAMPLLGWALRRTDDALARAAYTAGRTAEGGSAAPASLQARAAQVAAQALAVLGTIAQLWRGRPREHVLRAVDPLLGPPLFASAEEGRALLEDALLAASHRLIAG